MRSKQYCSSPDPSCGGRHDPHSPGLRWLAICEQHPSHLFQSQVGSPLPDCLAVNIPNYKCCSQLVSQAGHRQSQNGTCWCVYLYRPVSNNLRTSYNWQLKSKTGGFLKIIDHYGSSTGEFLNFPFFHFNVLGYQHKDTEKILCFLMCLLKGSYLFAFKWLEFYCFLFGEVFGWPHSLKTEGCTLQSIYFFHN